MHEYWERQYGLDLKEPNVGVVNVTDADSVWVSKKNLQKYREMPGKFTQYFNYTTLDGLAQHSRTNIG